MIHKSYATLSGGIAWNVTGVTCFFLSAHTSLKASEYAKQIQVTNGISHSKKRKALHNHLISCLTTFSGQHNKCDIRAAHISRVGCNAVEYTTTFLYSAEFSTLQTATALAVRKAVKTDLSFRNDTVVVFLFEANKKRDNA